MSVKSILCNICSDVKDVVALPYLFGYKTELPFLE